jgi:hypothetical protein
VISNCWFAGKLDVTGQNSGGILGYTEGKEVEISHCLNSGEINRTLKGNANGDVGGICGKTNSKLTIEDCLNTGTVTSALFAEKYDEVGAVVGAANGDATVVVKTTWWTKESCMDKKSDNTADGDGFGVNNAKSKDVAGCKNVSLTDLLTATGAGTLDYTNYWIKKPIYGPILITFKDLAK